MNITPKMLFLYVGEDNRNMVFCSKDCDNCPIKFTCFTNTATAYNVTLDIEEKKIVKCEPYYTTEELQDMASWSSG